MFKLRFLLALAIGYLLGAKAGRQRYDQLVDAWRQLLGTELFKQLSAQLGEAVEQAGDAVASLAGRPRSRSEVIPLPAETPETPE